jgi:hypothetical protein
MVVQMKGLHRQLEDPGSSLVRNQVLLRNAGWPKLDPCQLQKERMVRRVKSLFHAPVNNAFGPTIRVLRSSFHLHRGL